MIGMNSIKIILMNIFKIIKQLPTLFQLLHERRRSRRISPEWKAKRTTEKPMQIYSRI